MNIRTKKAQNTAEYAILIALVVAAAMTMQTYVKRSLQGGIKFAVDSAKKGDSYTDQYEPYYLESSYDVTASAYKDSEETTLGGGVTRIIGAAPDGSAIADAATADAKTVAQPEGAKKVTRSGYQKIRNVDADL